MSGRKALAVAKIADPLLSNVAAPVPIAPKIANPNATVFGTDMIFQFC